MSKYGHRPHNWFEGIVNKLGGEEGAERFLRGELIIKECERVFPTCKTLKLGTFKNVDGIRKALNTCGYEISAWASDMLGKSAFAMSKTEMEVELVNISVAELGFKDGARYADICKCANELGLDLCPSEVGPQLRLQYKDQPKCDYLIVAMDAIADSSGNLRVFQVSRDGYGRYYLRSDDGKPDDFWGGTRRFVFRRRK